MSFFSKDSKITLSFSEMEAIAKIWETKLELQKCPIILEFIPELYNKESLRSAIIQWSSEESSWIIYLYQLADKRTAIHELGHIYLAKILNNWYFVDSSKKEKIKAKELHPEISKFFNRLIDCFNDYNLSKFEEFYDAYVSHIVVGLNQYPDPRQHNLNESIFYYLKAYIDFNYILKPEDNNKYISEIKANLRAVKNSVIKKIKIEKRKLSFNRFASLDRQLDKFKSIKDSLNSKVILQFFYNTLNLLGFWSKKELQNNFKLYFNYIITK